ncbi:hypothetical protein HDU98_010711 [Podochytrium sp. JEL0797]|nr:hypothetical protein HDU98_010711 [Podochytrium sp. JEL0797]
MDFRFLDIEQDESMAHGTIATISFFRGSLSDTATQHLSHRIAQITTVNPWLVSRLEWRYPHSFWSTQVSLTIPNNSETIHSRATGILKLAKWSHTAETPIATITASIQRKHKESLSYHMHRTIRERSPPFKVTLFVNEANGGFALLVSMLHILGDSYTFYRVYSMLSWDVDVVALDPVRKVEVFSRDAVDAVFSPGVRQVARHPKVVLGVCVAMVKHVLGWIFCRSENRRFVSRVVDSDWIAKQKESAVAKGQWVSTNDCIVSWFCREVGCNLGIMVVNMRGRMVGIDNSLAGNYVTMLMRKPSEFSSPVDVRLALIRQEKGHSGSSVNQFLPWRSAIQGLKIGFVTNWTHFYDRDLDLGEGVEFVGMHPLTAIHESMPSGLIECCVVYCVRKGVVAVLVDDGVSFGLEREKVE